MDVISQFIWEKLSSLPNDKVQTETRTLKNGERKQFSYVHWMHAHAAMKAVFPDYTWEFEVNDTGAQAFYYGETAEVRCRMTVGGKTQVTSLPVYEFGSWQAKPNPTSDDINTAKQRCRVKAMAEFGLFYDLYTPEQPENNVVALATVDEPVTEQPEDTNQLAELWSQQSKKFRGKTDESVNKFLSRFNNQLRNLGIEESDGERAVREDLFVEAHQAKQEPK